MRQWSSQKESTALKTSLCRTWLQNSSNFCNKNQHFFFILRKNIFTSGLGSQIWIKMFENINIPPSNLNINVHRTLLGIQIHDKVWYFLSVTCRTCLSKRVSALNSVLEEKKKISCTHAHTRRWKKNGQTCAMQSPTVTQCLSDKRQNLLKLFINYRSLTKINHTHTSTYEPHKFILFFWSKLLSFGCSCRDLCGASLSSFTPFFSPYKCMEGLKNTCTFSGMAGTHILVSFSCLVCALVNMVLWRPVEVFPPTAWGHFWEVRRFWLTLTTSPLNFGV